MSASNALNNLARGAVAVGAGASLLQASMYNVDGGSRAVMFDRLRGVQASKRAACQRAARPAWLVLRRTRLGCPEPPFFAR
jgi:hypothetical protein